MLNRISSPHDRTRWVAHTWLVLSNFEKPRNIFSIVLQATNSLEMVFFLNFHHRCEEQIEPQQLLNNSNLISKEQEPNFLMSVLPRTKRHLRCRRISASSVKSSEMICPRYLQVFTFHPMYGNIIEKYCGQSRFQQVS